MHEVLRLTKTLRPARTLVLCAAACMLAALVWLCLPSSAFAVQEDWQQDSGTTIPSQVVDLATDGTNVYAATMGDGVYERNAQGVWEDISSNLTNKFVQTVCHNGTKLYAGTDGGGVFEYDSVGKTWIAIHAGEPFLFDVADLYWHSQTLYAGTVNGGVWYYNGTVWSKITVTEPNTLTGGTVWAVAVHNSSLYVGTADGVFRSSSERWTKMSLPSMILITSLIVVGDNMYAGTDGNGAFVFDGSSWQPVNDGLPSTGLGVQAKIKSLATDGTTVYAAVHQGQQGEGVFALDTATNEWAAINTNLADLKTYSLTFCNNMLFASTASTGVFRTELIPAPVPPTPPVNPPAPQPSVGLANTSDCMTTPLIAAVLFVLCGGVIIAIACLRRSRVI